MSHRKVLSGLVLATLAAAPSLASAARTDVFVHGRNSGGTTDVNNYWHVGWGANNDGVTAFTGGGTEVSYTYTYDASLAWSDLSSNAMPVCQLTNAMNSAPGTDMAVITHSAGGLSAVYMLAVAQNGWANSCAISPATAKTWATYVITNAAPFRGTEVADSVYTHNSGDFMHALCGNIVGGISNLLFDQANSMTYALQTSYTANYFQYLSAYGTYAAIYEQGGTARSGDDSTALGMAQSCAGVEATNDGFVSANSAVGCARGTAAGSQCMPYGHRKWFDAVGHSSNRRNDYRTFAASVWANNPY